MPRPRRELGALYEEELNGLRWGCRQLDSHTQSPTSIARFAVTSRPVSPSSP